MRVVIETTGLYTTQAGVARYIRGLLAGHRHNRPADLEISELAWEVENFDYRQPARALKTFYREFVWAPCFAPWTLRRRRAELFHATVNCLVVPPPGVVSVVTLHDLAFMVYPERFRRWQKMGWTRLLRRIPGVDRIICISRFTADEVMRRLGVPATKIDVVPNGIDFNPEAPPPEQAPAMDLPGDFFLFVGSLEPGKNLALLREVYLRAKARRIQLPPLLIVGARWAGVAGEGPPPEGWHYLGRRSDAELVYLYRRALALVFPSKYEGFGLPVLEAMALGCPVICSPVASLPEVAGEAALMVGLEREPYLDALTELAENAPAREDFRARGFVQARKFSWPRCAAETAEVYRRAFREKRA